jgi:hypothetical protein
MSEDALATALRGSLTNPSEDIARSILAAAGAHPDDIQRTISTGTGLVAYDLQAPAKNLYPVYTPVRNSLPRVGGGVGTATNWRQVNAIVGSGYDGMGWVPEGQRAGQMSYSTSNKAASYATIGEEDGATFEAINAARTFEDIRATMTMRLLQKAFLKEESACLFGNNSLALGTPATPTLSASGTGGTLPAATYSVIVVALTPEGVRNITTAGIGTTKTITGADGKTFTLNGGSSIKSANATQAVTLGQTLFASTTAIQGAAAYAWFVGTAGNEVLQTITYINSASFALPLTTGTQAATAVGGADYSTNSTAFNGLFTTAALSGSGAYVNYLATGTAGIGTPLTSSGRGSVIEIDTMMKAMWDNYQVSLDVLYVNSQELRNITTKVLTGANGGSLINYFQDPKAGEYIISAGGMVEFYYNPFMAPGAGRRIPIMIHPQVPAGTIIGWAKNLPIQYQSSEVPNVAEVKTRQDYYQIDWPITTRQRQVGVYSEEVLAVYAPFAMGIISNIANG